MGSPWVTERSPNVTANIRVRMAMQMAQDLETVNNAYHTGQAKWIPQGGGR